MRAALGYIPRMHSNRLSCCWLVLGLLSLSACGATRGEGPPIRVWEDLYPELVDPERRTEGPRKMFKARAFTPEQGRELDAAVALYIAEDPAFAAERDRLAEDPVTAFWLAQFLVTCVVKARQATPNVDEDDPTLVHEPVWIRPIGELRAMGEDAVPMIVLQLIRHRDSYYVELGRELLESLGPDAFPRWRGVLQIDDPPARRNGYQVLANWGAVNPVIAEELRKATRDPDFGIRAFGYRGLASDPRFLPDILAALDADPDPFVKREIVGALGAQFSKPKGEAKATVSARVAQAVVDYMDRCLEDGDARGMRAADASLRRMSGKSRAATVQAWRAWLSTLRAEPGL